MPLRGPLTYVEQTIAGTAAGFAYLASPTNDLMRPRAAFVEIDAAPIRFTVDGTTPTTSVGHLLNAGDAVALTSEDEVRQFRAIRTTSTSAVARVTFYDDWFPPA